MDRTAIGRHLAALVVPFRESLEVDYERLRAVCRRMLEVDGIDGLVVNAHAGEVDTLTTEEREQIVRVTQEETRSAGKLVVSGVLPLGGSYPSAISMAQRMRDAGADSLLLLGPPGFGRGVDAVPEVAGEYTQAVASAVDVPIIYFTAGPLSGINYTPEVIRQICLVDGVVAVKDTMWTPQGFETNHRMIRELDSDIAVLSGNDNCIFQNFISGADGTLLILHLAMAPAIIEMYRAIQDNDFKSAKAINDRYTTFVADLFARPMLKMPSRFKFVLKELGILENDFTRPPVPALLPAEAEKLARHMTSLELR